MTTLKYNDNITKVNSNNKYMKKVLIIISILALLMGFYTFNTFNKIIAVNESVDNSWAQVETQYQRRYDLIPNLVESVKGMMAQEKEVFSNIAEARTRYSGAANTNERIAAAGQIESALGRLMVIMENYPELKSANHVQSLMVQIEGTENRISVERKRYNDAAKEFNVLVKRVPAKWVAGMYDFEVRNYFESQDAAEVAPKVEF